MQKSLFLKANMKFMHFFRVTSLFLGLSISLLTCSNSINTNPNQILYRKKVLPSSIAHILSIPSNNSYHITLKVSPQVDFVERFASEPNILAVLNAGFFDPKNQKTTSYILQNGKLTGNPQQNERLMNNPDLQSYLKQILNRSEWRQYQCENIVKYSIAFHQDPIPPNCQLINSIGGGPRLLPSLTAETEAFITKQNGQIVRDALGYNQRNARTAIGITEDNHLIWIMIAQKPEQPKSGMSLPELANFLKILGVKEALNLDGGSSSSLYYQGKTFYGKIDPEGKIIKRPVKSVIVLQKNP